MLWLNASIETQRQMSRGEAAISVAGNCCDGQAVRRFNGFDRDMGGCRS